MKKYSNLSFILSGYEYCMTNILCKKNCSFNIWINKMDEELDDNGYCPICAKYDDALDKEIKIMFDYYSSINDLRADKLFSLIFGGNENK